jgi:hypothetical protein
MKTFIKSCAIGSIEYDPRRKYGILRTSNQWKSFLDRVWAFAGSETNIPVDVTDNERYYIIYTSLKIFAMRSILVIGGVVAWIVVMKIFMI